MSQGFLSLSQGFCHDGQSIRAKSHVNLKNFVVSGVIFASWWSPGTKKVSKYRRRRNCGGTFRPRRYTSSATLEKLSTEMLIPENGVLLTAPLISLLCPCSCVPSSCNRQRKQWHVHAPHLVGVFPLTNEVRHLNRNVLYFPPDPTLSSSSAVLVYTRDVDVL